MRRIPRRRYRHRDNAHDLATSPLSLNRRRSMEWPQCVRRHPAFFIQHRCDRKASLPLAVVVGAAKLAKFGRNEYWERSLQRGAALREHGGRHRRDTDQPPDGMLGSGRWSAAGSTRARGWTKVDFLPTRVGLDRSTEIVDDCRHRPRRNHAECIFLGAQIFRVTVANVEGRGGPSG